MAQSTEVWVNDKLHDILGISDKYIAQYFVGLATKSESPADLVKKLQDTGTVDVDDNIIAFAKELFDKVSKIFFLSGPFTLPI